MPSFQATSTEFLRGCTTTPMRIAAVEAALNAPAGQFLRQQMAHWVTEVLPAESVVPEIYALWRPLVTDAMRFMVMRLSTARLAPKLVEQIECRPKRRPNGASFA